MASKNSDYISRYCKGFCGKSEKDFQKVVIPKRVLVSRKVSNSSNEGKSCSTGVINNNKKTAVSKPKKTTKSVQSFRERANRNNNNLDICTKCGDSALPNYKSHFGKQYEEDKQSNITTLVSMRSKSIMKEKTPNSNKNTQESVKQYYKNENFRFTESIDEIESHFKRVSLDPIKEVSEIRTVSNDSLLRIYSDTENLENDFADTDHHDGIEELKQFRQQNYFECHSAKSRIKNKGSTISLQNHKCVYRFYLNERLFPVPLNADYNDKIRCVECHLPMDAKIDSDSDKINGTIQAKVKLGSSLKDMTLLLPAKEPMIIKEKRTENKSTQEVMYFGVIKLSADGNSVFNRTLPNNSLALKYQKGYTEYENKEYLRYKNVDEADVIIV